MVRTFIQVLALSLTLVASLFLLKANFGLSVKNIAEISSTRWDYNSEVARSLAQQQADTAVGFFYLLLAFGLQMGNLLWPEQYVDFKVDALGAILAIVTAGALLVVGWRVSAA